MKQSTWNVIEQLYVDFPSARASTVPHDVIDRKMRDLAIYLPSTDYKEFVHRYGAGIVGPYLIYGFMLPKAEEGVGPQSFWELTGKYREQKYPYADEWIIFSDDGAGNPFGFDKDGKVWTYDHDCQQLFQVGEDFEDFILNECLRDDDDAESDEEAGT